MIAYTRPAYTLKCLSWPPNPFLACRRSLNLSVLPACPTWLLFTRVLLSFSIPSSLPPPAYEHVSPNFQLLLPPITMVSPCLCFAGLSLHPTLFFIVAFHDFLARQYTVQKNRIYVFPKKELRGLSSISYIHVSVSDLYIPTIGPHIWLQQNRQTILEIFKSLTDICV